MADSFHYEAIDGGGRLLTGKLDANHEREAQRTLESQGLTLVALTRSKPEVLSKARFAGLQRGATVQDRMLALKQLALLLKAGVSLVQGIGTLKNQATHPSLAVA